jgi:hypothetical protein
MTQKKHGVCFSDEFWQQIKDKANQNDISMGDYIRLSVKNRMNQNGGLF